MTHSAKNPIQPLHTSPGAWLSLVDVERVIRSNIRDFMYFCTETEGFGRLLVTHSAENSIEPFNTSPGAWLSLVDVERVIRNNTRDLMYLCTETEGRMSSEWKLKRKIDLWAVIEGF